MTFKLKCSGESDRTNEELVTKLTCSAEGIASVEALAYAHGFQFCLTATSLQYFYNFQYPLVDSLFVKYALGEEEWGKQEQK